MHTIFTSSNCGESSIENKLNKVMSTADEIKKLNDLLKDGLLTQEEYDSQKKTTKPNSQSQNQWIVVLLLAFFLGFIGAHSFTLVKTVLEF